MNMQDHISTAGAKPVAASPQSPAELVGALERASTRRTTRMGEDGRQINERFGTNRQ